MYEEQTFFASLGSDLRIGCFHRNHSSVGRSRKNTYRIRTVCTVGNQQCIPTSPRCAQASRNGAEANVSRKSRPMGQASRTTKLLLDFSDRRGEGANTSKRAYLEETGKILDAARAFYLAFFLAHPDKLTERVQYFSEKLQQERERLLSPHELLSWAESLTVETAAHPSPLPAYNFSQQFPDFPFIYRRSVIKDAIGKVRSYLSNLANWRASGKKQGRPGSPGASNHPTLYDEAFSLDLDEADLHPSPRTCFARLKVYTGTTWDWHHYPVKLSRYFEARWRDPAWENQSPKLILRPKTAALHFAQVKTVAAKKVKASKEDPHLVTVAVDLNVKNLAVITVRQDGAIIETIFVRDQGLDRQRYGQ